MTRPLLTAYDWAPDEGRGLVRDMRVRWALEEVGQTYDVRYLHWGEQKQPAHRARNPFGQVPAYEQDGIVQWESGAIVLHIAQAWPGLLPDDPASRARAIDWLFAALNTVEPVVWDQVVARIIDAKQVWAAGRWPSVLARLNERLHELAAALGDREWLDDAFSAGDLVMVQVLRHVAESILAKHPTLTAYVARGMARPAFQRALADLQAGQTGQKPADCRTELRGRETMAYIEGFLTPVPTANKHVYVEHARRAADMIRANGAVRFVETWGDDVPHGKLTDLHRAVEAKPDETVLFSWFEYPDKATRDAANAKMMADPAMAEMAKHMPFDGSRMVYAGFAVINTAGEPSDFGYLDGCVTPVATDRHDDYLAFAKKAAAVFIEYGAVRVVDGWGDDVPDGQVTDYKRATHLQDGESVGYGWIEWPSKAVRDAAWEKVMADERLAGGDNGMDGKRMMFGGFAPLLIL